ncbi:hypothetical protein [Actinoplanes sp. DH11]|uniref:hypothetical protein n=1 Tax=Actinoplanes sp. DH11 TaxID=2857011 RepID=UPI001E317496|nr:hypothetical protein [Actinoplanes sp. DH11]
MKPRARRIPYVLVALTAVLAVGAAVFFVLQQRDSGGDTASGPTNGACTTASKGPAGSARSFPDADCTGVPAGVSLEAYDGPCKITDSGTVIQGQDVTCSLIIQAADVVIRNSKVTGVIKVEGAGHSLRIEDSDVDGGQAYDHTVGFENVTVLRSDIRGGQNSVNCYKNCLIQDSYLHGQFVPEGEDWHLNAFLSNGGVGIKLIGNTLACDHKTNAAGGGCTADASIFGDFGPNTDYTVQGNLFVGSDQFSYCFYGGYDPKKKFGTEFSKIVVRDNVFERGPTGTCGSFGAVTSFHAAGEGNVWSGNVWENGTEVPSDG